jgi:hypothetical protein
MPLLPKPTIEECPEYLGWIRSLRCVRGHWGPCHSHHQPGQDKGGMGLKVSDFRALPLCPECHDAYHRHGRSTFWGEIDFEALILQYNLEFFLLRSV